MKHLPSIKTLESAFPSRGRAMRKLLESADAVRQHPAAIARLNECYNPPGLADMRMHALNAVAETHGVEYAEHETNGARSFEYLNTGDTYAATLIRFNDGRYVVASWGDIVERGNYK